MIMTVRALALAGFLVLLWPGWGIPQEGSENFCQEQYSRKCLMLQKQQKLIQKMKAETQQAAARGYSPEQMEQLHRAQQENFRVAMKRLALEKPQSRQDK